MFIAELGYLKPMADVDAALADHRVYLKAQYDAGVFLFAGPKVPRTGGVIIGRAKSLEEFEAILAKDPLKIRGIAEYKVTQFAARSTAADLGAYKEECSL